MSLECNKDEVWMKSCFHRQDAILKGYKFVDIITRTESKWQIAYNSICSTCLGAPKEVPKEAIRCYTDTRFKQRSEYNYSTDIRIECADGHFVSGSGRPPSATEMPTLELEFDDTDISFECQWPRFLANRLAVQHYDGRLTCLRCQRADLAASSIYKHVRDCQYAHPSSDLQQRMVVSLEGDRDFNQRLASVQNIKEREVLFKKQREAITNAGRVNVGSGSHVAYRHPEPLHLSEAARFRLNLGSSMERQGRLREVFARIAPSLRAQPPREPAPEYSRPISPSQQSPPLDSNTSQRNHATDSKSSDM